MTQLQVISLDDWEGVYDLKTGKLITQGHRVDWDDVISYLGVDINGKYINDEDSLGEFGNSLPPDLETILEYIERKKL